MATRRDLANVIRYLSMEKVQHIGPEHPGADLLGLASSTVEPWNCFLHHTSGNRQWLNRGRFALSSTPCCKALGQTWQQVCTFTQGSLLLSAETIKELVRKTVCSATSVSSRSVSGRLYEPFALADAASSRQQVERLTLLHTILERHLWQLRAAAVDEERLSAKASPDTSVSHAFGRCLIHLGLRRPRSAVVRSTAGPIGDTARLARYPAALHRARGTHARIDSIRLIGDSSRCPPAIRAECQQVGRGGHGNALTPRCIPEHPVS